MNSVVLACQVYYVCQLFRGSGIVQVTVQFLVQIRHEGSCRRDRVSALCSTPRSTHFSLVGRPSFPRHSRRELRSIRSFLGRFWHRFLLGPAASHVHCFARTTRVSASGTREASMTMWSYCHSF